jgi:hypothetical protein
VYAAVALVALSIAIGVTLLRLEWPAADSRRTAIAFRRAVQFERAAIGAAAKCEGIVKAAGEPIRAPLSGAPCVAVHLTIREDRGDSFEEVASITDAVPFELVAHDGTRIPVSLGSPDIVRSVYGAPSRETGPVVGASAELVSFCARHGFRVVDEDGFARRREFDERAILTGGRYCVVGQKIGYGTAPEATHLSGYRGMPRTVPLALLRVERHLYAGRERTQVDCGSFQPSLLTFQVMDAEDWFVFVGLVVGVALALCFGLCVSGMGALLAV